MKVSDTLNNYFQTNPNMEPHVKKRAYDGLWESVVPRLEFNPDGTWSFYWLTVAVSTHKKIAELEITKFYANK